MEGNMTKKFIDDSIKRNERELSRLQFEISQTDEAGNVEIDNSISEIMKIVKNMRIGPNFIEPTNMDFTKLMKHKEVIRSWMKNGKKSFPRHGNRFKFGLLKIVDEVRNDLMGLIHLQNESVREVKRYSEKCKLANVKKDIMVEFSSLSDKLKNLDNGKISDGNVKDFQKMSEILIKSLSKLKDPYSEIDHILYKNGMLQVDEPEKKCLIDPEELLANIDLHDFCHGYFCMVNYKNILNQCIDNAFLKLVEHRGSTKTWHLDKIILTFLESKIMYRLCIGLKIFKTNFYANGFKDCIQQDLCYAVSDLSKIPDFVDRDENEMARFVAKHAKDCHDLIGKKDHLPAYRARDIIMEIKDGKEIGQYEIRALYGLIKSGESPCGYLHENGTILAVVDNFLCYIRHFYMKYEEMDEEMREIDKHNGQEFGGFSIKVVTDDDMKKKKKKKKKKKPLCASDGLEKSTLNKYFFYDDAMKTLSLLSFLYNYVENFDKDELQQFKVESYVTQFVINLIHQHDSNKKIDKPIWIMEKILNTCHFIVFCHDEKKEKDIFLNLMNGDEIDEEELSCLMDFAMNNKLSYEDEGSEDAWPHSEEYDFSTNYEDVNPRDLVSSELECALEMDLKLDLIHEQDDSMEVKHHSEKSESMNDLIQLRDSESKSERQGVVSGENEALLKYEMKQLEFEDAECVKVEDKVVEPMDSSKSECAFAKEEILKRLNYLSYGICKFKRLRGRKMTEDDMKDFQKMSEILIKYLPKLEDPCPGIDHILYKNGMLQVDEPEKKYLIDPEELLANIDIHDISYTYSHMVHVNNTVNQCFDIAFLKLIEHKGKTRGWHLDWLILELLKSKIIYKICIGLKIFKTYLKFGYYVTPSDYEFSSLVSDLSQIPEVVNIDDNEMARFVARHAKECYDFLERRGKFADEVYNIFNEMIFGHIVEPWKLRALYQIMKPGESSFELYSDMIAYNLRSMILSIVRSTQSYLSHFDMMYRELDEEMREIDKHNGQEFGGFSLEVVADDDMKKPLCASDGLEKSTLNKYFFYDDAMKILSVLSFFYNYVEKKMRKDELQHFKVKSHVTDFVIKLIHQRDLNQKIDKPIWIMEKILNTCHFIVFGRDEEEEKDIFLKLMNGEEIDKEELIRLKGFMKKDKLSYKYKKRN